VREAFPDIDGQGFYELLDGVYATGERIVANAAPIRLQATPEVEPTERFLDFIYEPVRDEGGTITGIFIEGYDVTEAHVAREALRASEARYRLLFESIESGFCIVEVDPSEPGGRVNYRVLEANPAFFRQTGFPKRSWVAGCAKRRLPSKSIGTKSTAGSQRQASPCALSRDRTCSAAGSTCTRSAREDRGRRASPFCSPTSRSAATLSSRCVRARRASATWPTMPR
jgi:hypothetical protein